MARLPDDGLHPNDLDSNEFLTLPADPEEEFAIYHRMQIRQLDALSHDEQQSSMPERRYIDAMLAYDQACNLDILSSFLEPPFQDNDFYPFYHDFRRAATMAAAKILIRAAQRQRAGAEQIVVLDDASRPAIRKLIEAIRKKLESLTIPENKREALFRKLDAFALEVDLNRTRTESFFVFAVDASKTAREAGVELVPLQETIDRLSNALDRAKKWYESLPPWRDQKRIEPPRKRLPAPDSDPSDDDTPF